MQKLAWILNPKLLIVVKFLVQDDKNAGKKDTGIMTSFNKLYK